MMRWHCETVQCDREGYYFPRWDLATPITVTAQTKQDAVNKVVAMMGQPRRGRYWGVRVLSVEEAS